MHTIDTRTTRNHSSMNAYRPPTHRTCYFRQQMSASVRGRSSSCKVWKSPQSWPTDVTTRGTGLGRGTLHRGKRGPGLGPGVGWRESPCMVRSNAWWVMVTCHPHCTDRETTSRTVSTSGVSGKSSWLLMALSAHYHTDTQTNRQTDRQMDRQMDRGR